MLWWTDYPPSSFQLLPGCSLKWLLCCPVQCKRSHYDRDRHWWMRDSLSNVYTILSYCCVTKLLSFLSLYSAVLCFKSSADASKKRQSEFRVVLFIHTLLPLSGFVTTVFGQGCVTICAETVVHGTITVSSKSNSAWLRLSLLHERTLLLQDR